MAVLMAVSKPMVWPEAADVVVDGAERRADAGMPCSVQEGAR